MRDYWIIVDSKSIVIGDAEVKAGSLTKEEVMAPHDSAVQAFSVSEEIYNEQRIGESFTTD